jgi:hypothetical protein
MNGSLSQDSFHSTCGKLRRKAAEKNDFDTLAPYDCGKREESPSFFRTETRSSGPAGTAILSKPLQRDAEFFRTHLLLLLLRIKTWF